MSKQHPSYHDVVVYVNEVAHRIADNYSYELTCTRSGGWQLWWHPMTTGKPQQLGGEFHPGSFRIEVRGVIICQRVASPDDEPDTPPLADGWTGIVGLTT